MKYKDEINIFMNLYMYNLEQYLITNKDKFDKITFQLDEANTDRPLKEFLKDTIETYKDRILYNQEINLFKEANSIKKTPAQINDILNNIVIDTILLP